MPYCLPRPEAKKMMDAIAEGKLSPEKLNKMTSSEVRSFLSDIVGQENAKQVNLLYEKTKLLKNPERGAVNWARQITGLSKEAKEATIAKIKQTYADKKRRLWEPEAHESFLNEIVSDVYSKKLRTEVTLNEAQIITELGADATKNLAKMNDNFTWKTKEDGINFGASKVAFDNYVGGLKTEASKRPLVNPLKQKGIGKFDAIVENSKISLNFIADNSRAIVASFDNSFWGRQGVKVMLNPKYADLWAKNFAKSFVDITKTLKGGNKAGDAIIDGVKAEIYTRKNYLNGRYEKGKKLDIGIKEEEFPSSAPSKIPVLGRLFRASEVAYEAGAMRLRVDVVDRLYKLAEKNGVDLTNKATVGDINQLVNSMTGRGDMGLKPGTQAALNKAFFSIKKVKSDIDFLTDWAKASKDPFVRKQAAQNLLMVGSSMATILAIANALDPNSVEEDPRSANFGKIRIGDTRFDVTGGIVPLVILMSRIAAQSKKSATTDIVTKAGETPFSEKGMDLLWGFTENKFSPMASVIKELINQETFEGKYPTLLNELKNLTVPIIIQEGATAAQNEHSADLLLVLIAESLGISANVYSMTEVWEQRDSQELKRFKYDVGAKKFKEANKDYNEYMGVWMSRTRVTEEYKALSDDDKAKKLTKKRKEIKKRIFYKYRNM